MPRLVACLMIVALLPGFAQPSPPRGDYVVLLHGLIRTTVSMRPIANYLQKQGFVPVNIGYPSTKLTLAEAIPYVEDKLDQRRLDPARRIHFVCHSLGCLIVRGMIQAHRPANLGSVVMLGPPNHGSTQADKIMDNGFFTFLFGPVLHDLGTDQSRIQPLIGTRVDYPTGIIAGTRLLKIPSFYLSGEHDGRVTVESAKIEGMTQLIALPVG